MFRAVCRSSSGAPTVFAASGLHTRVVTARSRLSGNWWWATYRSKHVELLMNKWNNNFRYRVESCWLFILRYFFFFFSRLWIKRKNVMLYLYLCLCLWHEYYYIMFKIQNKFYITLKNKSCHIRLMGYVVSPFSNIASVSVVSRLTRRRPKNRDSIPFRSRLFCPQHLD